VKRKKIMTEIAKTPKPPYYAVIFTSHRTKGDNGYGEMANKMVKLASKQPGFLGVESARESVGITVSYWKDLESIKTWKENADHIMAQQRGKEVWYKEFKTRISKVERDYGFTRGIDRN
jgi:heme-degrading monooxygenase HmoA